MLRQPGTLQALAAAVIAQSCRKQLGPSQVQEGLKGKLPPVLLRKVARLVLLRLEAHHITTWVIDHHFMEYYKGNHRYYTRSMHYHSCPLCQKRGRRVRTHTAPKLLPEKIEAALFKMQTLNPQLSEDELRHAAATLVHRWFAKPPLCCTLM